MVRAIEHGSSSSSFHFIRTLQSSRHDCLESSPRPSHFLAF
jgi:hypothetical protein